MRFLIDGYNLMHALGYAPLAGAPQPTFHAARRRMLDWLAEREAIAAPNVDVRVVFDAQNSPRDLGSSTHRGLTVTYSFRKTADDLLEDLMAVEPASGDVKVVSNDRRLQQAAKRNGHEAMGSDHFLDWLERPPAKATEATGAEDKPAAPLEFDLEQLLEAFRRPKD